MHVLELVKWRASANVSDKEMAVAVDGIQVDLKRLPGFLSQALYKDKAGVWVGVYRWKTEAEALASNDLMANKPSFLTLMALIEGDSIAIEILDQAGS